MAKQATIKKKPTILKNRKNSRENLILGGVLALAVALFAGSLWLWWTKSFTNADSVFQSMLENNLTSQSITRTIEQSEANGGVVQNIYVSFTAPEVISESKTVITEKNQDRSTTKVTTKSVGTSKADYVKYESAEGTEGLSLAGNLDNVLGVWGKRGDDGGLQSPAFLNEAAFSVVPFGNLPTAQKNELMKLFADKDVYEYTKAEKKFENGRYVYNYRVSLKPSGLIEVLKKYAELSGVGDSSQLDPANYEGAAAVALDFKVDIMSRQLLKIDYLSSGRVETIENRGLKRDVKIPGQTIPLDELQQRISGMAA